VAAVRLRPLTEAECYTRCYGTRDESVNVLRDESTLPGARAEKSLRELVEERLAELEATEQEAA